MSGRRLRMPHLNDAEPERVQIVISQLSQEHLQTEASFPAAVASAMEIAVIFNDMSGKQKRALVTAVMREIAEARLPHFTPYLPLVESMCDTVMHAAKHRLELQPSSVRRCFPCLSRQQAPAHRK